jgi:hypothetical protein
MKVGVDRRGRFASAGSTRVRGGSVERVWGQAVPSSDVSYLTARAEPN